MNFAGNQHLVDKTAKMGTDHPLAFDTMTNWKTILTYCFLAACTAGNEATRACPFCSATSQTLSEEIAAADVVVVARLLSVPPEFDLESEASANFDLDALDTDPDSGTAEFEIIETLHGKAPDPGTKIKVVYFGSGDLDKKFMLSGIVGKDTDWRTPMPLTDRSLAYIKKLETLPEKGPDRLTFFLGHLEDKEPLLAQDAYDEFARAPYELITKISDRLDRKQLLSWIEDPQVGPTRRRLYLTLLGICGQAEDIAVLEALLLYDYQQIKPGMATMMAVLNQTGSAIGIPVLNEIVKADVRRKQQCLDALIAAYLKLKGPAGLPLIEQRFLANPSAEYSHLYAAIMALRFHGEETDELPRPRLLESVRLLLDNESIADQVIPDLARWEDWSVLEKLVNLFKESKPDAWVRPPVISYLITAEEQPGEIGEQASKALAEIESLDPKGVKRARSYVNFGMLAGGGAKQKPTTKTDDLAKLPIENTPNNPVANAKATLDNQSNTQADTDSGNPSRLLLVGGPLIAGLFLFGVFALLLRGTDVRSSGEGS